MTTFVDVPLKREELQMIVDALDVLNPDNDDSCVFRDHLRVLIAAYQLKLGDAA